MGVELQPNGHPTWKGIYAIVGAGIATAVGTTWIVFWAMLGVHNNQPHEGAARMHDIDTIREDIREFRDEVKQGFREVRQELREK